MLETQLMELEELVDALICKNCGCDRAEHDLDTNKCLFGPTHYEPRGIKCTNEHNLEVSSDTGGRPSSRDSDE